MTDAVTTPRTDRLTELRRQTEVLVEKDYPALAGLTAATFRELVRPLAAAAARSRSGVFDSRSSAV